MTMHKLTCRDESDQHRARASRWVARNDWSCLLRSSAVGEAAAPAVGEDGSAWSMLSSSSVRLIWSRYSSVSHEATSVACGKQSACEMGSSKGCMPCQRSKGGPAPCPGAPALAGGSAGTSAALPGRRCPPAAGPPPQTTAPQPSPVGSRMTIMSCAVCTLQRCGHIGSHAALQTMLSRQACKST